MGHSVRSIPWMLLLKMILMEVSFRRTDAGDFAITVDQNATIHVGSMDKILSDTVHIPLKGLRQPVSVNYDPVDKMVYWTDINIKPRATISRAYLNGSHQTTVVDGLLRPVGVALDIESRMVYWTDDIASHIGRAPMDGQGSKEILIEDIDEPRAIIVHQGLKKFYWTTVGTNGSIRRADLNGSNAVIIVERNLAHPNGIAIDYEDGYLYWVDNSIPKGKLERSDQLGNKRILLTELDINLSPFDLAYYGGSLYWTDSNSPALLVAYRNGKGASNFGPVLYDKPGGIHIQKEPNYCDSCPCSNGSTCIDVPNGFKCNCQDGFEGATCSSEPVNLIAWLVGPLVAVFAVSAIALSIFLSRVKRQRNNLRVSRGREQNDRFHKLLEVIPIDRTPDLANTDDRLSPRVGTDFSFPRHLVVIMSELGNGQFGRVMLATAIGIIESEKQTIVAVKTIKEGVDSQAKDALLEELGLMKAVGSHPNIVRLLGCCVETDPIYIILEYLGQGNLKTYLSKCKTQDPSGAVYVNSPGYSQLLSRTLVKFAMDVANAMVFLSSRKCIHRDLAARNVLISDDMECKVSDFGLSRDVTNERIYIRKSKVPLPMRWMAFESLLDDVYTTESDVWSFGILLWELVTLGCRPYPLMSVKVMVSKLKQGYRMPRPACCNEQMYSLMLSCWRQDPTERPTFKRLYGQLGEIFTEEMDYLIVDKFDDIFYDDTVVDDTNEII